MAVNRYIGARYVPVFADPIEHDTETSYEALTIVTDSNGASYTSKQAVPVGVALSNEDYWVCTGNYNSQVEAYRQEVRAYDSRITVAQDAADDAASAAAAAQVTADDAASAAGDAANAAAAAQSTADSATSAAAAAQSTADSATSAAAAAQSAADSASAAAQVNANAIANLNSEVDYVESVMPPAQSQSTPFMAPAYIGDYIARYQSACVCANNGSFYMFNASNYDSTGGFKYANLESNAAPVDMISFPVVGHANSCAFVPFGDQDAGYIWLAMLYTYSGGTKSTTSTLKKYTIASTGDSVSATVDVTAPEPIMAISYDHKNGYLWAFGGNYSSSGTASHNVYRKQTDADVFDLIGTLQYKDPIRQTSTDTGARVLPQDIAVKGNIAFFCFNDGTGMTFDLRSVLNDGTAEPLACFRIGYTSNSGLMQFGECEGWEFDSADVLYQMRDCTLSITEEDSHTGQDVELRFSVVTSLANGDQVQTDMSGDFGTYEILNVSADTQTRFSLTGSQIRSLNSLLLRVMPPVQVNVYGSVTETHPVKVIGDLNLSIGTNTYTCKKIYQRSGKMQIFIQSGGSLIVTCPANENFIDAGARNTDLAISNRGTITINNAISHFCDFGYQNCTLSIVQFGTVTSNRFIWGDLTITGKGYWVGNHNIVTWS